MSRGKSLVDDTGKLVEFGDGKSYQGGRMCVFLRWSCPSRIFFGFGGAGAEHIESEIYLRAITTSTPTVTNHQCTAWEVEAGYIERYSDLCKPSIPHTSSTLESTTHFHALATHAITQDALPSPPNHQKETVPSCRLWLVERSLRF